MTRADPPRHQLARCGACGAWVWVVARRTVSMAAPGEVAVSGRQLDRQNGNGTNHATSCPVRLRDVTTGATARGFF